MLSPLKESKYVDSSSQTEEDLIYNYAWTKFYHHFNQNSTNQSASDITSQFYDCKNGLFFDAKNALYFEQSENLYIDKENKRYYHYILNEQTKTYHLRYHSKISKPKWKILKEKLDVNKKEKDIVWIESDSSSENERHIANEKNSIENTIKQKLSELNIKRPSLKNDVIEIDSDLEDGQLSDITTQYPPCIRAILMNSTDYDDELICTIKKGTLFIIPYTGGTIGKNSNKNIIDLINEDEVDNLHAKVEYDLKKKSYFIQDKETKHGTFLNKEKLEPNKKYELKHNDQLEIGKIVTLLIHIHNGSNTCLQCEPGEVMQKFKIEKEKNKQRAFSLKGVEESRREINRSIKNKYGIKWNEDSFDHVDRSKIRRKQVGIDTSHICDEDQISVASVNKPIDSNNLGLKLLKNMGWKEGQGLGRKEDGIKEPIKMVIRPVSSGLGYNDAKINLDASEEEKKKLINWNKIKTRYNLIDKQSQKNLSNVFNVDDDEENN